MQAHHAHDLFVKLGHRYGVTVAVREIGDPSAEFRDGLRVAEVVKQLLDGGRVGRLCGPDLDDLGFCAAV